MNFEHQELNNFNFSKTISYLSDHSTVRFRFYTIFVEPNRNRLFSFLTTRNRTGTAVPVPVPGNFWNRSTLVGTLIDQIIDFLSEPKNELQGIFVTESHLEMR